MSRSKNPCCVCCAVLCWLLLLLQGVSTHIKLKAAGELQDSGKREVYFEANGVPRVVEVVDKKSTEVLGKAAIREKVRGLVAVAPEALTPACFRGKGGCG